MTAILDHRLERAESLIGNVGDEFREVLDRLIAATEHRDQVVADLAGEVRYRYYDEPVIEAARERTYAEMEDHLRALGPIRGGPTGGERMQALVECPRPLAPWLTSRISRRARAGTAADRGDGAPLLPRSGRWLRSDRGRARSLLSATRARARAPPRGRVHRASTTSGCGGAIAAYAAEVPAGVAVADIYTAHPGEAPSHDELAARLQAALARGRFPRSAMNRLVLAVAEPRRGRGMSAVDLFTFRLTDGAAPAEDESLRGLHPMMAERLRLWRFANFSLERLPSAEDVYLFRARARANPKDERLFAIAEVRDLTPCATRTAAAVALPEFEQMLLETLQAIRSVQVHQPPRRRALWNRVVLYAWPTLELSPEEIRSLVARNSRATARSGSRWCCSTATMPDGAGGERPRVLRFFSPTGAGSWSRSAIHRPSRCSRWTRPGGACCRRRRGQPAPGGDRQAARPASSDAEADQPSGTSSSTSSTPRGGWSRRPSPGDQPDRNRRRADAQPQRALPRGDAAG